MKDLREQIQRKKDKCKLNFHGNRMQIPMPRDLRERYGELTCAKCAAFDEVLQLLDKTPTHS